MKKHIVILGGGFGGIGVYRALHHASHGGDIRITIIDRNNFFTFTPMLHEVATGSVERSHIVQPLREILHRCPSDTFLQAEVTEVDPEKKRVVYQAHGETHALTYDALVIALGSRVQWYGVPGAQQYTFPLKTLTDAVQLRNRLLTQFEKASIETHAATRRAQLQFVIIGGGPTGVELAGQIADLTRHELQGLYREIHADDIGITVVQRAPRLLPQFREETSAIALARLKQLGVRVLLDVGAAAIDAESVTLTSGDKILTETAIWSSGVQSVMQGVLPETVLTPSGQVRTTVHLTLPGFPHTFVLGDAAALDGKTEGIPFVPQTAQAAAALAPIVARNVLRSLRRLHSPMETLSFTQRGYIMPIGDWFAVGEVGRFVLSGRVLWMIRRFVFLQQLSGWWNRIRVFVDWNAGAIVRRDTSQL